MTEEPIRRLFSNAQAVEKKIYAESAMAKVSNIRDVAGADLLRKTLVLEDGTIIQVNSYEEFDKYIVLGAKEITQDGTGALRVFIDPEEAKNKGAAWSARFAETDIPDPSLVAASGTATFIPSYTTGNGFITFGGFSSGVTLKNLPVIGDVLPCTVIFSMLESDCVNHWGKPVDIETTVKRGEITEETGVYIKKEEVISIDFGVTEDFQRSYITADIGLEFGEEPELAGISEADIPPAMRGTYPDAVEQNKVKAEIGQITIESWDNGCVQWGIGTSADGMDDGQTLDSFTAHGERLDKLERISYAYNFTKFWRKTLDASCPYDEAPKCGEAPYLDPSTPFVIKGNTSFVCAQTNSFEAFVKLLTPLPGYNTLEECDPSLCGIQWKKVSPKWTLTSSCGDVSGWSLGEFGGVAYVTGPLTKNACCGAVLRAETTFEGELRSGQKYSINLEATISLSSSCCEGSGIPPTCPEGSGTYPNCNPGEICPDGSITYTGDCGSTLPPENPPTCPDGTPQPCPPCADGSPPPCDETCPGSISISGPGSVTCGASFTLSVVDQKGNPVSANIVQATGGATGGGGSYNAPSSNAECSGNSVFVATYVCANGTVLTAQKTVTYNCDGAAAVAYKVWGGCYSYGGGEACDRTDYRCDGTVHQVVAPTSTCGAPGCCSSISPPCGTTSDVRTPTQKTNGCCPEAYP